VVEDSGVGDGGEDRGGEGRVLFVARLAAFVQKRHVQNAEAIVRESGHEERDKKMELQPSTYT